MPKMIKEGIQIDRETDASVLLEKRSWLKLIKAIAPDNVQFFYPTADEEVVHVIRNGIDISFIGAKGSSFAASMAERMRVAGANPVLRLGTCGALNNDIELWSPIVTTACYSDEGTSQHYLDRNFPLTADFDFSYKIIESLKKYGLKPNYGLGITTDGRWREQPNLLNKLSKLGVLSVEMETAAIFAVSHFRHLIAGAINIPTDYPLNHTQGDFKGVTDHDNFEKKLSETIKNLFPAIIEVLIDTRRKILANINI